MAAPIGWCLGTMVFRVLGLESCKGTELLCSLQSSISPAKATSQGGQMTPAKGTSGAKGTRGCSTATKAHIPEEVPSDLDCDENPLVVNTIKKGDRGRVKAREESPEVPPPVDDEADEVDEDEVERECGDVDDEDNLEEATVEDISLQYWTYDFIFNFSADTSIIIYHYQYISHWLVMQYSDFGNSSDDDKASARQSKTKSIAKVDDSKEVKYVEVDTCLAKRSGRAVTSNSLRACCSCKKGKNLAVNKPKFSVAATAATPSPKKRGQVTPLEKDDDVIMVEDTPPCTVKKSIRQ
ncbi:hypothetical protein C8Q76DRAFT_692068 [Earliella scabrosa]|nr:hypothetical protein C8Q76DRAFT_692068 [Earliella scabrosa]